MTKKAKAPRFDGYSPASPRSSYVKSKTPGRDTRPEMILRRALWASGLRYRVNVAELPGKPDLVFKGRRLAVFCDGDFFHAKDWDDLKMKLARRANASYWIRKLEYNRRRDREVNKALTSEGWTVLRFWESDIRRDVDRVKREIQEALEVTT